MNRVGAGALALAIMISGCQTKYGAMGAMGGVEAQPITHDTFRVVARGNGYTDKTTIEDYVLLKAAETTVSMGGRYFAYVGGEDASQDNIGQTAGYMTYGRGWATYNPGVVYNIHKPGENAIIRIVPAPGVGVFDAQEIMATIGPRVQRQTK